MAQKLSPSQAPPNPIKTTQALPPAGYVPHHKSGSSSGVKGVSPQPIGGGSASATSTKGGRNMAQGGRAMLGLSFAGWIGTILFIVLAYDILTNWQGAVAIENSSFSGGTTMIKALEGR